MSNDPSSVGFYPTSQPPRSYPLTPAAFGAAGSAYGIPSSQPSLPNRLHAPQFSGVAMTSTLFGSTGGGIPGLGMQNTSGASLNGRETATNNGIAGWTNKQTTSNVPMASLPGLASPTAIQTASSKLAVPSASDREGTTEEGEISEGEVDEFYEPRGAGKHLPSRASYSQDSHPNNERFNGASTTTWTGTKNDVDGSSIYDAVSIRGEMIVDSTSASLPATCDDEEYEPQYQGSRDRSASYSPRLSPLTQSHKSNSKVIKTIRAVKHSNVEQTMTDALPPIGHPSTISSAQGNRKNVTEAKKKAQEAILGLWSMKIRYQDFINEGIDPDVMSDLFKDLGLDRTASSFSVAHGSSSSTLPIALSLTKPQSKLSSNAVVEPVAQLVNQSMPAALAKIAATITTPATSVLVPTAAKSGAVTKEADTNGTKTSAKSATVERKDRIARMLEAKKQKTVAPSVSTSPVTVVAPSLKSPTAGILCSSTVQETTAAITTNPDKTRPDTNTESSIHSQAVRKGLGADSSLRTTISTVSNHSDPEQGPSKGLSAPTPGAVNHGLPPKPPSPVAVTLAVEATASAIPTVTQPKPVPAPTGNDKIRHENNLKLQQKLAALRKSQEERKAREALEAQGKAKRDKRQDTLPPKPQVAVLDTTPSLPTASTHPVPDLTAANASSQDSLSKEHTDPKQATLTQKPLQPAQVFSTESRPAAQNRVAKRPVAAEFDGHSFDLGSFKRSRTQDTLIIDVSDDEDVEMEFESPNEVVSNGIQQRDMLLVRQTSLGSFPPLSNTGSQSWRTKPVPKSPSTTPATPEHGDKIDALQRQIEETKKMIAKREADKVIMKSLVAPPSPKAQAARSSLPVKHQDSTTDNLATPPPSTHIGDSISGSKLPHAKPTSIKLKQARLKLLELETARLKLELEAEIADEQTPSAEQDQPPDRVEEGSSQESSVIEIEKAPSPPSEELNQEPPPLLQVIEVTVSGLKLPAKCPSPRITVMERESGLANSAPAVAAFDTPIQSVSGVAEHDFPLPAGERDGDASVPIVSPKQLTVAHESSDMQLIEVESVTAHADQPDSITAPNGKTDADVLGSEDGEVLHHDSRGRLSLTGEQVSDEADEAPNVSTLDATEIPADKVNEVLVDALTSADEHPATEPSPRREPSPRVVQHRSLDRPHILTTIQAETVEQLSEAPEAYESPLKYFHAYRFHPRYRDFVAGGLKSMTYSSNIDINKPLCPSLVASGSCSKGSKCEFQHFDSMVLPEHEIITQLGSADSFQGEQKKRFIDGLRVVLHDLKLKKVLTFDHIAQAIIDYRSRFREDASKILPLDGILI